MSANKKDESEKPIAVITYDYEKEPPMFYATGARIMALGPLYVKLNFFIDNLQDDIAEEAVFLEGDKQRARVTKRRFEGPRQLKREFEATVMIPISAAESLAAALSGLLKQHKEDQS